MKYFPSDRAAWLGRRLQLIPAAARAGLYLLMAGALWLNVELAWSLRETPHAPPPTAPTDAVASAAALAQRHLFGTAGNTARTESATAEFRLLGLLASNRPEQGAAILQAGENSPPVVARVGQTIAPGIRLSSLNQRQATLSRAGGSLTLSLPTTEPVPSRTPPATPHKPVFD